MTIITKPKIRWLRFALTKALYAAVCYALYWAGYPGLAIVFALLCELASSLMFVVVTTNARFIAEARDRIAREHQASPRHAGWWPGRWPEQRP